ncbi:autophagy protein Atg13 [Histoplasma capsulatum var. duboisii H88]|uniref:Autophagy protein Atg13 n=1 Tax=Ajellomyces capsulatus (strain H88) TaxID=544711 RepID=A0A8A1M0N8_AJEC8|nr:autophagy protein Atg13 [Histoplasma capsulatum var. duboisii H88]
MTHTLDPLFPLKITSLADHKRLDLYPLPGEKMIHQTMPRPMVVYPLFIMQFLQPGPAHCQLFALPESLELGRRDPRYHPLLPNLAKESQVSPPEMLSTLPKENPRFHFLLSKPHLFPRPRRL